MNYCRKYTFDGNNRSVSKIGASFCLLAYENLLGRRNNVIKVTLSRFEVDSTSQVF